MWKEKIRFARKSALEKLDIDYTRAVESGGSTTQIVKDKNTLRALEKVNSFSFFKENILPKIFLPDLVAVDSWNANENIIEYDDAM